MTYSGFLDQLKPERMALSRIRGSDEAVTIQRRADGDLPAFFGPVITGEQRQLQVIRTPVFVRVLLAQCEPALPAGVSQPSGFFGWRTSGPIHALRDTALCSIGGCLDSRDEELSELFASTIIQERAGRSNKISQFI